MPDTTSDTHSAVSLQVITNGTTVFESRGNWLHPLFELEEFFAEEGVASSQTEIRDKVVGKAAALLIVRLGIKCVHAGTMSRLALDVFERRNIRFSYDALVDRIDCRTEEILLSIDDPDDAYEILRKRAGR